MEKYQKGERKAHILRILHYANGPITIGGIIDGTCYARSTIRDCLNRLELEHCIIRQKFVKAGINPCDYKLCEKGKSPKFFYMLKYPAGLRKLHYYIENDVIEP